MEKIISKIDAFDSATKAYYINIFKAQSVSLDVILFFNRSQNAALGETLKKTFQEFGVTQEHMVLIVRECLKSNGKCFVIYLYFFIF